MVLRYLHRPHRPGHVAPRGHPVPELVEVVGLRGSELVDADGVHPRCPGVGPDPLPRLVDEAPGDLERLHLGLRSVHRLLPRWGWPLGDLACPAPSLQGHYSPFVATTSRSVPVPRIGTLPLAVSAACGPPFCDQGADFAHFNWPTASGRQVLLFRASACDGLTPPLHRAPPGRHAGCLLAEGASRRARLCPGVTVRPRFRRQLFAFRCVSSGSAMFVFPSLT